MGRAARWRYRGREVLLRRPPLGDSSERIALANAFADLRPSFGTHVLAIQTACAF
jgi:hypothetical protein